jgi:excisionase family DNA binding protein
MGESIKEWFSLDEYADRLGVGRDQIYRRIKKKKIRVMKIGGVPLKPFRIHITEIERLERSAKPKPKPAALPEPDSLGLYQDEKRTAGAHGR